MIFLLIIILLISVIFNENVWIYQKMFIGLSFSGSLASMVNVSSLTTCISLNNQLCMARPTLLDLSLN